MQAGRMLNISELCHDEALIVSNFYKRRKHLAPELQGKTVH